MNNFYFLINCFNEIFLKGIQIKGTIVRAIQLVYDMTPGWTIFNSLIVLILGFLPLINLYLIRLIINSVTLGISSSDMQSIMGNLIIIIIIAALVSIFTVCCKAFATYCAEAQSLILTEKISGVIHVQSVRLDLPYYDNAEYQDSLHLAQSECIYRPRQILNSILNILQNLFSIGAIGYVLFSFSPISGVIILVAAIPAIIFKFKVSKKIYDFRTSFTETNRKNWYFHNLLTSEFFAKEIRLYSLGEFFINRYQEILTLYQDSILAFYRVSKTGDIITQSLIMVAMFGSFTFIAIMTVEGNITIGDMVMYFMGFQLCIGYVQSMLTNMSSLYEDQLFLHHLFHFLDLKPTIIVPHSPVDLPAFMQDGIEFKDVSFTYPGEKEPALSKINITLHKGEVIAIVGKNGAGKSTLINLLCRFYIPDSGKITLDGIDIAMFDPDDWRKRIAILFQNFVRYQMSSQDNIRLANIDSRKGDDDVREAAKKAQVDGLISQLPEGYETILGKYFSHGHELSGGEWQKIALARAFFRNSDIIVLDEPTSSLDVYAEAEIFRTFRDIAKGHSVILISHRFSTIMMADTIYVLENGTVTEHGTHDELIRKNGRYAEMFRIQVEPYFRKNL